MKIINSETEIYAILGDPISHSLSPVIMNSSFNRLKMDKVLLGLRCNKDAFANVMETLKTLNLKGYVFTMPVKELVPNYIDELKDEAAIIGAVNCVINSNGYLIGYNTDSKGFWNAIQDKKRINQRLNKLFVFGMGGFSKASVTQAALQGIREIIVTNHFEGVEFVDKFKRFLDRLYKKVPDLNTKIIPWDPLIWKKELIDTDVIVNATPNGLGGKGDLHIQVPYKSVNKEAIYFDAIYKPVKTKFLEIAEERGHITIDGLDLLSHQGVCSFELWTGKKVAPKTMKSDALYFLNQSNNE